MKKLLTVLLALCLMTSLVACFAVSANAAEDIDVVVGNKFEWNDQSSAAAKWREGNGKSEDGLWQYHLYRLESPEGQDPYRPLVWSSSACYAWNKTATDAGGIGYARVRDNGATFHPATKADVVKTFYCPSGGTIEITSVLSRVDEIDVAAGYNGSSFAIYVEDRLVYPEAGGGDYLILDSTTPQTVTVKNIEVAKNEHVHIHIGAVGEQSADLVRMTNSVRYTGVNDSEIDEHSHTVSQNSYKPPEGVDVPTINNNNNNNNNGGNTQNNNQGGGLSTGAIIGIVIGGVAVIGIAVAVVVILKKKQQQ